MLYEGCVWPGHPSSFDGSLRIPTSCPAHIQEPPGEASPDIHWQSAWHDWRDVPHKACFWLAYFWALLFPTNISYKNPLRQESHLFFRTWVSSSATYVLCDLKQLGYLFGDSVFFLVKWDKLDLCHHCGKDEDNEDEVFYRWSGKEVSVGSEPGWRDPPKPRQDMSFLSLLGVFGLGLSQLLLPSEPHTCLCFEWWFSL